MKKKKRKTKHRYRRLDPKEPVTITTTIRFGEMLDKKLIAYSKKHQQRQSTVVRWALWDYLNKDAKNGPNR